MPTRAHTLFARRSKRLAVQAKKSGNDGTCNNQQLKKPKTTAHTQRRTRVKQNTSRLATNESDDESDDDDDDEDEDDAESEVYLNVDDYVDADDDEYDYDSDDDDQPTTSKAAAHNRRNPFHQDPVRRVLTYNTRDAQERVPHFCIPSFNLCQYPLVNANQMRAYPECKLSTPQPIYVSGNRSRLIDICHLRPLNYDRWRSRLTRSQTEYNKLNAEHKDMEKKSIYHKSVLEFSKHRHGAHDVYFQCSYDYYYSGGNLCIMPELIPQVPTPVLLHASGERLRTLNVSNFDVKTLKTKQLYSHDVAWPSEIFEMQPLSCYRINRPNTFVVRQKHGLSLRQIKYKSTVKGTKEANLAEMILLNELVFELEPIISMAQSKIDPTRLLFTTMAQHIYLFDMSTTKPKMIYDIKASLNDRVSFNTVRAWKGNKFFWANDRGIVPIDLRQSPEEWPLQRCAINAQPYLECDKISAVATTERNHIYVATSHKLHCIDVRKMPDHPINRGAIAMWTHQLEYPPAFIDTYRMGNNEYVAMASSKADDIVICELSEAQHLENVELEPNQNYYATYTQPYQPPTLEEALTQVREKGHGLKPEAQLTQRIKSCNTGLKFYVKNPENVLLMSSNSLGDVFARTMTTRENQDKEERNSKCVKDIICHYESEIIKNQNLQPSINYSAIHNFTALKDIFDCAELNQKQVLVENVAESHKNDCENVETSKNAENWCKSVSELKVYKDALAADLLTIWTSDSSDDENPTLDQIAEETITENNPTETVKNWLEHNVENATIINKDITSHSPIYLPEKEYENVTVIKEERESERPILPEEAMISIPFQMDKEMLPLRDQTFVLNDLFIDNIAYYRENDVKHQIANIASETDDLPLTEKHNENKRKDISPIRINTNKLKQIKIDENAQQNSPEPAPKLEMFEFESN